MTASPGNLCDDEDLLRYAGEDLIALVSPGQTLASGHDGTLVDWTLSGAVDFQARGVASGRVVHLSGDVRTPAWRAVGAGGMTLVADSASGTSLVLRRPGLASGVGQPPGPDVGSLTAVSFRVPYFDGQIADASRWVNRELAFSAASDATDQESRRELCVLATLHDLYFAAWRQVGKDIFGEKAKGLKARMATLLGHLISRRSGGPLIGKINPVISRPPVRGQLPYRGYF